MSHFKINFEGKNQIGAIAIIGGGVERTEVGKRKKEEQEKFLSFAAEKINPCDKTFSQLEEYLAKKYKAVPHTLLAHKLNSLKVNVILNHFNHILERPKPLGENPSEEEIKEHVEKDMFIMQQAKEYPAEKLGLQMKAYRLPNVASHIRSEQEQRTQNNDCNCIKLSQL